jgi:deoxyribonuclease-4
MGAETMVVHCGSCAKITRETAMEYAAETLTMADKALKDAGFSIKLGIETMGKVNQLGTLDEVLTLCTISKQFAPVVDFGHLNARNLGNIRTEADYEYIFDEIINRLGFEYADNLHCHFSKIEYTGMGEKKHLTFEDELYGPSPDMLAAVIAKKGLNPTIICESAGTQSADAKILKNLYENYKKSY